jgi:ABC-type branched-subunit amino acid transport system substrate-binding protein
VPRCPKFADDFTAKSADNGAIFEPGLPGTSRSEHPRGLPMKSLKLIGLALGASLALSTAALAQDITIAVAGPMTGGESAFGRQMKNGAEQAITDINAAGGVLGKKLALEVGDDACDPKQARSVAEKFASAKIPFVAGHYCSSSSIPASEAYADGNVLQITPASTNPLFTERKLWNVARVCGRDDQQGLVAADYIAKFYKGKNVAILNDKTTYGKGLADETKKALNKAGFTEKMFESYNKGDKDFTAIVSRMKRDNIDLVYVGGYHQESGLIVRQMRDQGLPAKAPCSPSVPTRATSRPPRPSSSVSRPRTSIPKAIRFTLTPRCRSGRRRWRKPAPPIRRKSWIRSRAAPGIR